jgi:DNA modification methylase
MSQLVFFDDVLPKRKLPTNVTTERHAVHRWFNFIAGFSPEFVSWCIKEAGLRSDDVLIDPFSGLATALVQANFEGVRSIGYEAHPFFYHLSQPKLDLPAIVSIDLLERLLLTLVPFRGKMSDLWPPDALKFIVKLVPETELRVLASAMYAEPEVPERLRLSYRLLVSRALESAAGAQTDGIYKAPTSAKRSISFWTSIPAICEELRSDVASIGNCYSDRSALYPNSSEDMKEVADESCALCVTSPPYLNNFDFAEMTRMELYFWRYATSWSEITERVRRRLIVNTTTAPTDLKHAQARFKSLLPPEFVSELEPLVDELSVRKRHRAGKKEYDRLVYPYFAQMFRVLAELARVLRSGASLHMLVADAALYGVHIQTERYLSALMVQRGFVILGIERLRNRGDRWILDKRQGCANPLGEFHIHARRG